MTHEEAERALLTESPVVYREIPYSKIEHLIYRRRRSGGYIISAALESKTGSSITIAPLGPISWQDEKDRTLLVELPPTHEDGPTPDEVHAKTAISTGSRVLYEGEEYTISALIVRSWLKLPCYWLSVELSRVSDRKAVEAWSGSVRYNIKHEGMMQK